MFRGHSFECPPFVGCIIFVVVSGLYSMPRAALAFLSFGSSLMSCS